MQQHLIALAVDLQLIRRLAHSDPAATDTYFEQMERDVQRALDETSRLGQRIYAPLLEAGGLAAALRSAAVSAGVPASVEVAAGSTYPPEVAHTVYLCWLDTLEHEDGTKRAAITLRDAKDTLDFEVFGNAARPDAGHDRLRDRVEALGGRLTVRTEAGGTRVAGSLPLPRRPSRSLRGRGSPP